MGTCIEVLLLFYKGKKLLNLTLIDFGLSVTAITYFTGRFAGLQVKELAPRLRTLASASVCTSLQ
jgi:hypothetical protein